MRQSDASRRPCSPWPLAWSRTSKQWKVNAGLAYDSAFQDDNDIPALLPINSGRRPAPRESWRGPGSSPRTVACSRPGMNEYELHDHRREQDLWSIGEDSANFYSSESSASSASRVSAEIYSQQACYRLLLYTVYLSLDRHEWVSRRCGTDLTGGLHMAALIRYSLPATCQLSCQTHPPCFP